jgi:signal transduction histidine kinase
VQRESIQRIGSENALNQQQLLLFENESKLNQLELEKNQITITLQKTETQRQQDQVALLSQEDEIKSMRLKKQTMLKNYLLIGIGCAMMVGFFVYRNHTTRQKLKLQTLRNKIANDLHDDVGSTLSSISIFSEMAQAQSKEVIPLLKTINESSRKMLEAMADIVWTINPENDQFENIIMRMRNFAFEFLGARHIDFEFNADEEINNLKLPMDVRKNLYLIFKEATNNMVKYSGASEAEFSIKNIENKVVLTIRDNGKGFDMNQPSEGNGIKSMRKRAAEMGADFILRSLPGKGTSIELKIAV